MRLRLVAGIAAGVLGLTGCAGMLTTGSAPNTAPAPRATQADAQEKAPQNAPTQNPTQPADVQKLAKSAQLSLRVQDPAAAAARLREVATANQGLITNENLELGETTGSQSRSTVTISVPADKLDAALDAAAQVGEVAVRRVQVEDVTTQVTDVESRIKNLRASIDRIRTLMRAAKDVGDIVSLESELTERETQLESMLAQQKVLSTRVARAPITVTLLGPGQQAPEDPNPFLQGLLQGWEAFLSAVVVIFTMIGGLLPFALLGLAIWLPIRSYIKRHRAKNPRPAAPVGFPPAGHPGPMPPPRPQATPGSAQGEDPKPSEAGPADTKQPTAGDDEPKPAEVEPKAGDDKEEPGRP